jgi:hypothetical protein
MPAKPKLTSRQQRILRAARDTKAVEVNGRSRRPIHTLSELGLITYKTTRVGGRGASGYDEISVAITAAGKRYFWRE